MADVLAKIEEGTKLHAIYAADGEYYVAKVVSVSTAKARAKKPVKVEYIGYDEQAWLPLSDLKSKKLNLKPEAQAKAKAKAKGKAKAKEQPKPDYSDFKKGLKIKVKAADDGKFYPAQVVQVSTKGSDAPIKINWVGYTSASDEWVGADRIKSNALKFKSAKPKTVGPLKNAAFVFIKPHAVTDKVKELVEAGLKEKGIKILKKGFIKGEVIDKKKLIDQHYYAIASKATILKPDQLNVPEDKFKAQFGLEWKDALASGKVFNAMDGCTELGIDADGLDKEWAKAKADKKLVKFGGGFYCGLIEAGGKALYIFNGFFMSMRSKFTKPGTQIYYYSVEWDPATLSWEDFRGKLLGPTDPAEAPADSLRGQVLAKWKDLCLESEPNVGDNGVHASASPFEAFAERNNWMGMAIEKDSFGSAMLASRVPEKVIKAWSVDPQVKIEEDKMGSIFDALEDMDAKDCLAKVKDLSGLNRPPAKNAAFVFIKPHAVTDAVKSLVKEGLEAKGIKIIREGSIKGEVIDKKKLIDQHYYAIASKATILKPDQLNVPEDKFKAQFGLEWKDALASGKVFNAMDGCKELGIDADGLDAEWAKAKADKKLVKFGGGFYCGLIEAGGKALYVFNGFFMSMRSKFTKPGTQIHYYSVEWDPATLSWEDFRGKLLGPTDPAEAPADSLRGQVLAKWKDLGLESEPNVGDNGVHASASPFEAFAERTNWMGIPLKGDRFAKQMLAQGVPIGVLKAWSVDPQVKIEGEKMGSIFDALEDLNVKDCHAKLVTLAKLNKPPAKNAAFVFIKPHAVTDAVKTLVKAGLEAKGITIKKEGSIKGEVIDKKKLIDQHYYAIASKATILKPDQLNVPEDKFKAQFGLEWKDALASGKVFNAMDGCKELGIDADGLDAEWAKAKADKKLVKFGGGFYCGLIEAGGKALYIFNGFFMSMRSKFTKPGTQIHYYSVEWDPSTLSWEDFRGKVLGPTDPAEAPKDSLRGEVLAKWKDLGLEAEPNVGDNAVHASASPFEAFAERNNWLKVPPGRDTFGRTMLSEGVPMETIKAWSVDPQVNVGDGKMGSIFDALEDMNVDDCLAKVVQLSKAQ